MHPQKSQMMMCGVVTGIDLFVHPMLQCQILLQHYPGIVANVKTPSPSRESVVMSIPSRSPCCSACSMAQQPECVCTSGATCRGAAEPAPRQRLRSSPVLATKRPDGVCIRHACPVLALAELAVAEWMRPSGRLTCHCISYTSVGSSCKH